VVVVQVNNYKRTSFFVVKLDDLQRPPRNLALPIPWDIETFRTKRTMSSGSAFPWSAWNCARGRQIFWMSCHRLASCKPKKCIYSLQSKTRSILSATCKRHFVGS